MNDTLTMLTEHCLAEELEEKINETILFTLSMPPTVSQYNTAKLALQDLFHQYRRRNPCRASAFTRVHRCVYQVYVDAYEKLASVTPVPDTAVRRKSQNMRTKTQPKPTKEEALSILLKEIEDAGTSEP